MRRGGEAWKTGGDYISGPHERLPLVSQLILTFDGETAPSDNNGARSSPDFVRSLFLPFVAIADRAIGFYVYASNIALLPTREKEREGKEKRKRKRTASVS